MASALPFLAAALLAACSTHAVNNARLGTGSVDAVALVEPAYRVSVRMDDGSLQAIDQESSDFQVGDRVRVVGSGRVIRP